MPPRRRTSKSQSISSLPDTTQTAPSTLNGMPPPASPIMASSTLTPARKRRARSTQSPVQVPAASSTSTPAITISKPSRAAHSSSAVIVPVPRIQADSTTVASLKFVGVVISSTILEAALQTLASTFGTGELAAVSKYAESWLEIGTLLGWKVVLLGIYWFGGFDVYDVASLSLLLWTPYNLLLSLFYQISPLTLAITTSASIVSACTPWLIFHPKPVSASHRPSTASKSSGIRNRPIISDPYTTIATSLLAASIFAVLFELAFATFLPVWLITYFYGLRNLEAVYLGASGLPTLLVNLIPAGIACMEYLFAPSTSATSLALVSGFNPVTSSIKEHIYHNAWGWYSPRQKSLIFRSGLLAVLMVANSLVQIGGTLAGSELRGVFGYAMVWACGVAIVGMALDWVGGPSD